MSYLVAGHVLLFKNVTLKAVNVIIDKTSINIINNYAVN